MKIHNFFLIFIFGLMIGIILTYVSMSPAYHALIPSSESRAYQETLNVPTRSNLKSVPCPTPSTDKIYAPILMYHHVKRTTVHDNAVEVSLSVSPEDFEDQMSYLYRHNYNSISLKQLVVALNSYQSIPCGSFVITFDDGYADIYNNALPIMQKYHFKGIIFLIANKLDLPGYLSGEQVKELIDAGFSIGSHSFSHRNLTTATPDQLKEELIASKQVLSRRFKTDVDYFCYPIGKYNYQVINMVQKAGYSGAVSTLLGTINSHQDIWQLKRDRVGGQKTLNDFINKLAPKSSTKITPTPTMESYW